MEENKTQKVFLTINKPTEFIEDTFDIFSMTYLGKLTVIVDYFESISKFDVLHYLSEKDAKGNSPLEIACFLGFKNIVLYFLKWGVDPLSLDLKQRNCFHFMCFKREYSTLTTMLNFKRNQIKEQVYYDFASLKTNYGLKNIDVKGGKLIKSGYINSKTKNNFKDFIGAIESLAVTTFQEYLQFYKLALSQQDTDGRNPLHFSNFEKLIVALLDLGLEKDEGFDDFVYDWQQLKHVEDHSAKCLDPRKYNQVLKEFKHFLDPDIYRKIMSGYNKERKQFIQNILNTEDNNGQTPLHIVSRKGNYVLVRHFLRLGADPYKRDNQMNNSLDIAENKYVRQALTNLNEEAIKGNESNITRLVDEGENINERSSILGEGPIHKAILSKVKDKKGLLKAILQHEPDINLIDNNGWTALHHSAYNGDNDTAQELCKNLANVNAYSNSMKTPLHFAAMNGHAELISLLVSHGAKIEGISNQTLLTFAPKSSSIVMDNIAPLLLASKKGHTACVSLLLTLGANLYVKDSREWNCLHFAAYNGHSELVKFIIDFDEQK